MKRIFTFTIAFLAGITVFAQGNWPKTFQSDNGASISIYEPQPEFISGEEFTGRAAISVKEGQAEPVFGAILFTARLKDGRSSRNIQLQSMRVTRVKFSGDKEQEGVEGLAQEIEAHAIGWDWGMTKSELEQSVQQEKDATSGTGFNNRAPKVLYANKPTTLIVLDGEPRVLYDKELATDKVVNSPNIIFKDKGEWHLYAGGNWYKSNNITHGWKHNSRLSSKVRSVNEAIKKQERENNDGKPLENNPRKTEIIVSTEPAELIQSDGSPVYKNVAGTSLLYVSNSPNDIFKDINTQKTYIVLAGRWYTANNMNGPWEFVESDQLPEDFAKIPEGSDKDGVLANVAGTEAAETAVLDASIPQTARVDRKTAKVDVQYDGDPEFAPIRGTSLRLAENANLTVMLDADGNYFALDNGIWFISDDPYGPWIVANDRPRDLDDIPASSPAYHSRYVHIYDVTPDYVYMGYTPGYLGSYVYGPTIIYGTGYHYRPWFRRMYYPRPLTWGFGFGYNPWFGWNFNFGYNFGYTYVGFWYDQPAYYGYGGGWFGPHRYCPAYRRPYWSGGYYGRGDYYYGRNRYYDRNYYGSATRRDRQYYGNANNGTRPPRMGNNLYVNQPGVSTRNVARVSRVYRPGEQNALNTSRPANGRYTNRLSPANRNGGVSNNNGTPRTDRGNEVRNPSLTRPQNQEGSGSLRERAETNRRNYGQPRVNNGEVRNDNQEVIRPGESGRNLPRVNNPQRENNPTTAPQRVQRPAFENGQPRREYQNEENRQPERAQRPAFENRQPERVQRPVESRQPERAQRPAFENRQSAPRSSNSGSSGNSAPVRRPDRR